MDIKAKALNHALQMLKASGAQYVVIDPEGNQHKHGGLEVVEQKTRRRRSSPFPHGTYAALIKSSNLDAMQVGDVLVLDPQGFNIQSLRSTAITAAEKVWGKKSLMTAVKDNKIEALRIY